MVEDNFILRWELHEKARTLALESLWKNSDYLDVTIACDDDQIDAHKVILSAASPFFRKILKRNPHSHPLLYLKGTRKKDIEALIEFIYSGETEVVHDELEEFMALANSLEIQGLAGEASGIDEENLKSVKIPKEIENAKGKEIFLPEIMKEIHHKASNQTERKELSLNEDAKTVELLQENWHQGSYFNDTNYQATEESVNLEEFQVEEFEDRIQVQIDLDSRTFSKDVESLKGNGEQNGNFDKKESTSLLEYDQKVAELVTKLDNSWMCTTCQYSSRTRGHVLEHAELHIDGYAHECSYCCKTFNMKRKLRHHVRKCKQIIANASVHLFDNSA